MRDGRYASSPEKRRQRYRCYPDPADRKSFHRFTPTLPRDHVHTGTDHCDACEELRGTHRGDQTVSRRQSWSARIVAEALRDLARGGTYAQVSKNAWDATGRTRTRTTTGKAKRTGAAAETKNRWHTAADWVETFGPVLWERVEARLRSRAAAAVAERDRLRAAGEPNPKPVTIVIDDLPVYAKWMDHNRRNSFRKDYAVLTIAEVHWRERGDVIDRDQRLRLARAYPNSDHHAWKLALHELGYVPDFIVSDADDSQMKAIREFYGSAPVAPIVIPSMFHIRLGVENGLLETPGAFTQIVKRAQRDLRPELADQLAKLSRTNLTTMSGAEWAGWWDDIETCLEAIGAAVEPTRLRRNDYEAQVAAILPLVAAFPQLPLSTGGVEVAIRRKIEPILDGRAHGFANLARTNALFDLVVCDDNGLFNRMPQGIRWLRADSADHDGWSPPLRQVADPRPPRATAWTGRYSSLRDQIFLRDLARSKGLS